MQYLATIHAHHCPTENIAYFRMLSAVVWWVVASLTRVMNDSGIPSAQGIYSKSLFGQGRTIHWEIIAGESPASLQQLRKILSESKPKLVRIIFKTVLSRTRTGTLPQK